MSAAVNLYEVIGCPREATKEQILAEYRQRVLALHPDKVGAAEQRHSGDEAIERFQQLQFAKEVLADERKREHYDLWLQMGQGVPLNDWMANQDRIRQTFHWAAQQNDLTRQILPPKMRANDGTADGRAALSRDEWQPHESAATKAFRNYKI